ncbi:MAG: divergent polysaccharide deacetylase family protein, partial [Rhodospirillaceae bacterium]|nr:divergent polysaccharide deacetylase family protein [Rhodospirillaceae bacterium]
PRTDRTVSSQAPKFSDLPHPTDVIATALPKAPMPDLQLRNSAGLVLPTISPDGRRPWQAYGRPFAGKPRTPRIAIVVRVGLSADATRAAIETLPPDVTLAFDVNTPQLQTALATARKAGHETLLEISVESSAFPAADPGPNGLLTTLSVDKNQDRLHHALARGDVYTGLLVQNGDRYTASAPHFTAFMNDLKHMGLAYIATRRDAPFETIEARPAHASIDVSIPSDSFRERIAARLQQTEAIAKARGHALLVTDATPLALSMVLRWSGGLPNKSLQLAPISAMVKE